MEKNLDQIMMAGGNLPVSIWIASLPVDDRQIATEAVYLCLRNKAQINRMELGSAIRELLRKMRANDLSQ